MLDLDFSQELFRIVGYVVTLGHLLIILGTIVVVLLGWWILLRLVLPRIFEAEEMPAGARGRARRVLILGGIALIIIVIIQTLDIDYSLRFSDAKGAFQIKISQIVTILLTLSIISSLDWFVQEFLMRRFRRYRTRRYADGNLYQPRDRRGAANFKVVRPVVYTTALLVVMHILDYNPQIWPIGNIKEGADVAVITLIGLFNALLIFFVIRLLLWVILNIFLSSYYNRRKIDFGSQFAINRLLTYFVYVVGILIFFQTAGFNLFVLWTGAAALLVGVGIGLQQTFNDLISGVIILFERKVEVGDMVQLGDLIGTVKKIGTRTSIVETRAEIVVIVPNSRMVGDSVTNWSQFERKARFAVKVGVAYGSDTAKVKAILEKAASSHQRIMEQPKPFARFIDFGNSSLDFELFFWSRDFLRIEDIRSDLRFAIDQEFRRQGVEIPFPQRDLWLRNPEKLYPLLPTIPPSMQVEREEEE